MTLCALLAACGGGGSDAPAAMPKPQAVAEVRPVAVFIGDSITEGWDVAAAFHEFSVTNAGISGQTTAQMSARFKTSVLDAKPAIVVIEGCWNDIHKIENADQGHVYTMAAQAKAAGARVLLLRMTPTTERLADIAAWNRGLEQVAASAGVELVDTFTPMADGGGSVRPGLLLDRVHPNVSGYAVMTATVRGYLGLKP